MKKIENLTVTVQYSVGLGDVEVSDEVYEALDYLAGRGKTNCDFQNDNEQVATAFEWLQDHIREQDAFDWNYEVELDD